MSSVAGGSGVGGIGVQPGQVLSPVGGPVDQKVWLHTLHTQRGLLREIINDDTGIYRAKGVRSKQIFWISVVI
jgi:hypothetical protein